MSPVTMNFAPGERYFDHFDLVAFEHAGFLSGRPRPWRELHLHPVAAEPLRQIGQAGLHPLPHLERALPIQGRGQSQQRLPAVSRGAREKRSRPHPPQSRHARQPMHLLPYADDRVCPDAPQRSLDATAYAGDHAGLPVPERLQPLPHQQRRRLGRQARARVAQDATTRSRCSNAPP